MRLVEIYFWCMMYLSTYLLVSLVINLLTGAGDLVGITLIGLLLTLALAVILVRQAELEERELEELARAEIVTPVELFFENQELLEVNQNAEKEETKPNTTTDPAPDGLEPEPKLRTDVGIAELDAPDDSVVS